MNPDIQQRIQDLLNQIDAGVLSTDKRIEFFPEVAVEGDPPEWAEIRINFLKTVNQLLTNSCKAKPDDLEDAALEHNIRRIIGRVAEKLTGETKHFNEA